MTTSAILLEAADLDVGERKRIDCIFCGERGRTLGISRADDGTVLWNCFRASCAAKGVTSDGRLIRIRQAPRKQAFTPFTGELAPLTEEQMEWLERRIGWTQWHRDRAQPRYAPAEGRYAYPIYGPTGRRRGWCLRTYDELAMRPKVLTRMDCAEPHISWYVRGSPMSPLLVVEDIPSAVRASAYIDAVALCGTACGPDYANEIAKHARRVIWALDADAQSQALNLLRQHQLLFEDSALLALDMDLKDMDEESLRTLLGEVKLMTT